MHDLNSLNALDLATYGRMVASATSANLRGRWSKLSVWHLDIRPLGTKRWVAEVQAMSSFEGERTITRRLASGTLERALKMFHDSELGIMVCETAREYAEENNLPVDGSRPHGGVETFSGDTDAEALAWLYGQPDPGCKGFVAMAAADFGMNDSTIRANLQMGTALRVPLRAVLPYFDRAKFRLARAARKGDKA